MKNTATSGREGGFPVITSRSRVAVEPWRLPVAPAPCGIAADQVRLGGLEVRAASVVGPGHRAASPGRPRQDAYRLGRDSAGRYLLAAVADGMSDSVHSEVGANVAVAAAIGALRGELDRGVQAPAIDVARVFLHAAGQMHGVAEQRGWDDDQVRAVMAVAVIPADPRPDGLRHAWVAGLGDVSAWYRGAGGWMRVLGEGERGFDAGKVGDYLPYRPERVTTVQVAIRPGEALALLTDGIAGAFSHLSGGASWFAERWRTPPAVGRFLLDVGFEDVQQHDDRTAVVAWSADEGPIR
ncbi:protein phosphatase 2C domain-containing protein [Rhizohabitans arisaemae]|uniref:protein phosphatase 2C domain-containing protein n=1 Tax=Rhizohabitans arisaemae TaxID=2720610 RepID=UPI0024B22D41|nr:protein phosphatase 2C domain-containing protein [Rhizohabitans arisaemae]